LLHGDVGLGHVLIEGGSSQGYIGDMIGLRECSGGHPSGDIACWLVSSLGGCGCGG
jgi:hypothetical protein